MATSDVLNLTETQMVDEGIKSYEFHEYEPAAHSNLNSAGEIRIDVQQQDLFTLPSEAYLLFEGRLLKTDETSYTNTDAVTLTNNGIMHLFSQITYKLSNETIEAVFYPGQATTMLGMLKYPNDFQLAQGLNQLWYKDSATTASLTDNVGFAVRQAYIVQKTDPKGSFSFAIPLRHIFGLRDDYNKVIYGFKHTITLIRTIDNEAIFRNSTAADGKVELDKLSLFMPHVIPSLEEEIKLSNIIK